MGACVRPPPHPSSAARARTRCAPPPHHPAPSRRPPARCTRPRQPARRASLPPAKRSSKIQSGRADAEARAVQGGGGGWARKRKRGGNTKKPPPTPQSAADAPSPHPRSAKPPLAREKKKDDPRTRPSRPGGRPVCALSPPTLPPPQPPEGRSPGACTHAAAGTRRGDDAAATPVGKARCGEDTAGRGKPWLPPRAGGVAARARYARWADERLVPTAPTAWGGQLGVVWVVRVQQQQPPSADWEGQWQKVRGVCTSLSWLTSFCCLFSSFFRSSAAAFSFALHSGRWTRHFW